MRSDTTECIEYKTKNVQTKECTNRSFSHLHIFLFAHLHIREARGLLHEHLFNAAIGTFYDVDAACGHGSALAVECVAVEHSV